MNISRASFARKVRQNGVSLIELMISLAIGLLIVLAVTYVFAGSRANYRHQESLSSVQESGRIALELLTRDIRMAGYAGCGNLAFLRHLSAGFSNNTAIGGTTGVAAANPDSVTILYANVSPAILQDMPVANQFSLVDSTRLGTVVPGVQLLITDCAYTEILQITNVAGNLLTSAAPSRQYGAGSMMMRLDSVLYTVLDNELRRNGQAVAAGVTNMKLFYGIDSDGNRSANNYLSSPGLDWPNVVSVRVHLTISERDITMPFSTTITLRNRAP